MAVILRVYIKVIENIGHVVKAPANAMSQNGILT